MHNRKFRQPCLLLLLLLLCLTACAPPWPEESSAEGSRDPFEESSEIVMDNRRTRASLGCVLDKTIFSPRENDVYEAVYTGEVLRIPYTFLAEGMKEGLGFVVFLDGQAQPYYTGRDATERYCHVFHPEDNKLYSEEIFLQPVTGRRGEELQLLICNIWDPEFIPHPDTHPEEMSYSPAIGVRCHRMSLVIRFEADAAASPTAETADAAAHRVSVQREDLKEVEITGWSSEQLANEIEHHLYIDGREHFKNDKTASGFIDIAGKETMHLRYELWGSTAIDWSLVVSVDHRPVTTEPIDMTIAAGQKTVAELELDISTLHKDAILDVTLVPRNRLLKRFSSGNLYLTSSKPYYLYANTNS